MAVCRGCGENINWIKMVDSGKLMPVNEGEIHLVEPDEIVTLITSDGRILKTKDRGARGFEPHWATCPERLRFRTLK